jgi:hypothetical protein
VKWTPVSDPGTLLVHVVAPRVEEEATTDDGDVEGEETAAVDGEPEVAKKGKGEGGDGGDKS